MTEDMPLVTPSCALGWYRYAKVASPAAPTYASQFQVVNLPELPGRCSKLGCWFTPALEIVGEGRVIEAGILHRRNRPG
jgi:hypothetical protein